MGRFRSAEQIPADKRTRRRLEWEDTRRPAWVMWLSVACLIALVVTVIALSNSDRMSQATAINGDVLGPETGESTGDYLARAGEALAATTGTPRAGPWCPRTVRRMSPPSPPSSPTSRDCG